MILVTFSLYNPDNWKIERIDPTSKDFVPDDSFQAKDSGRTFDIRYSTEMINEINSMEEDGLFEFVWLTTWVHSKHHLLSGSAG